MTGAKKYRDLVAWQKANELAFRIFKLTDGFPAKYNYDLTAQLRRAALSIPTNLAEGCASPHSKELLQFINIANRSLNETQYLLEFAAGLGLIKAEDSKSLEGLSDQISKMLRSLTNSIKRKSQSP